MRLKTIELEAFRVFGESRRLDLDSDVVLLFGRNGFGKTTVFDGISWCLFGSSKRFRGTRDFRRAAASFITNAFRNPGDERVRLVLAAGGADVVVERRGSDLSVFDGEEAFDGGAAQQRLLQLLGFDQKPGESPIGLRKRALDSFGRSFLLHQDFLSAFVTSGNPRERFDAFADLFSLTPIREFYTHLASERNRAQERRESASRQSDIASAELNQFQRQLADEETRVARVMERIGGASRRSVSALSARLGKLLADVRDIVPDFGESEGASLDTLDRALLALSRLESQLQVQLSRFRSLHERVPLLSSWEGERERLRKEIDYAESVIQSKRAAATAAESEIGKVGESLTSLETEIAAAEQARERLNAFLSDGTEFVDSDECPLCLRPIARNVLLEHLHRRLLEADPASRERLLRRRSLQSELQAAEDRHRQRISELRNEERSKQALAARQSELSRLVVSVRDALSREVGTKIPEANALEVIEQRTKSLEQRVARIENLRQAFEDIRPFIELVETRQRLQQLQEESRQQSRLVRARRARVKSYERVEETLEALVLASRRAERSMVEEFISRFRQPIQNAYRWLSPHPLFPELDFEFDEFAEAGELYFRVSGQSAQLNPAATFSAAQANALALAVFLSLNAAQRWCPLELALIDDPVQNMDDVNALNLVDLVRNMTEKRQLVLSTSVPHLHRLLTDKLRPRSQGRALISHRFEALTEQGPGIETDIVEYSPPLRVLPELRKVS